jgi:eight-cysteine-cluster-containing protein
MCLPKDVAKDVSSICVYRDWYECLELTACKCVEGKCMWEPNEEYVECEREKRSSGI